jgi:hypothetical protein
MDKIYLIELNVEGPVVVGRINVSYIGVESEGSF